MNIMAIKRFKKNKQNVGSKKVVFYSDDHGHANEMMLFLHDELSINVAIKLDDSEHKDNSGYYIMVDEASFEIAAEEGAKFAIEHDFDEFIVFDKGNKKTKKIKFIKDDFASNLT